MLYGFLGRVLPVGTQHTSIVCGSLFTFSQVSSPFSSLPPLGREVSGQEYMCVCVCVSVPVRIPITLTTLAAPLPPGTLGYPPIGGEGSPVWGAPVGLGWAGWQGGSLLGGDHFRRPAGGRRSPLRWAAAPRLRLPRALGSGARRWGRGGAGRGWVGGSCRSR